MRTLEEMRGELETALSGFVRVSRGEGLFVSDAPRRGKAYALPLGYTAKEENGLLFISPELKECPEALREFMLGYLKADAAQREKLVRQRLAVALRQKNAEDARFIEMLEY